MRRESTSLSLSLTSLFLLRRWSPSGDISSGEKEDTCREDDDAHTGWPDRVTRLKALVYDAERMKSSGPKFITEFMVGRKVDYIVTTLVELWRKVERSEATRGKARKLKISRNIIFSKLWYGWLFPSFPLFGGGRSSTCRFCRKWSSQIWIVDYNFDTKSDDVNENKATIAKKKWTCRRHASWKSSVMTYSRLGSPTIRRFRNNFKRWFFRWRTQPICFNRSLFVFKNAT